jgi:hypothetical protein
VITVVSLSQTCSNSSLSFLSSFDEPISGDETTLLNGDLGWRTGPTGPSGALDFDASLSVVSDEAASENLLCG